MNIRQRFAGGFDPAVRLCLSVIRPLWRIIRPMALAVAFILPVYLFVVNRAPKAPPRISVKQVRLQDLAAVHVPDYRTAVPVLTYHDIANGPGRYTVSPEHFRQQIATLATTGFHTITAAQLLAFLGTGARLPSRPLLLTFDDGLGTAWRAADPVLKAYGMHGVAFVISGQLAHRGFYYLHPGELRSMIGSGRWDVEAHTHLGHGVVPVDAAGKVGPFLTNRAWLPKEHRRETEAEYKTRVTRDLVLNVSELRSYGADPQLFAYPFSPQNARPNDPRLPAILTSIVAEGFRASFVDANASRYLDWSDGMSAQQLPRFQVFSTTRANDLLSELLAAQPQTPSVGVALRQPRDWTFEGMPMGEGRAGFRAGTLALAPPAKHWQAAYYSLDRSDAWRSYTLAVSISGLAGSTADAASSKSTRRLSAADYGASASILIGNGVSESRDTPASPRYAVTVSAGRLSVSKRVNVGAHSEILTSLRIPRRSEHRVSLVLARGGLSVRVDGHVTATARTAPQSHGGIGLGVWREASGTQPVRFTRLQIAPTNGRPAQQRKAAGSAR